MDLGPNQYRLKKIRKYSTSCIWESLLEEPLSIYNMKLQDIIIVEEIVPYDSYKSYIQVKSDSKNVWFLKLEIVFNSKGRPNVFINPTILETLRFIKIKGKLLLDHR
jgi:hypothetical protein